MSIASRGDCGYVYRDPERFPGVVDSATFRLWAEECLKVLGRLFRGATAFPPGRGVWRDDAQDGELVFDDTVLVTAYVDPELLTTETLAELRRFLHRIGREANQGEVGVVIGGEYYGIVSYDSPEQD